MDTSYGESVNPLAVIHFAPLVRVPCDVSFLGGTSGRFRKRSKSAIFELAIDSSRLLAGFFDE
jgi:hypothetical protein